MTSAVYLPGIVTATDKTAFLPIGLAPALLVGFFEELGWAGFAISRLRLRHSVLATGLLVGMLWGAWHTTPHRAAGRLTRARPAPLS